MTSIVTVTSPVIIIIIIGHTVILNIFLRTLMEGDKQGGFSVFWADDGLDTGPILLQKSVDIDPNETVDTLYNRFLYPEGIKGMVRLPKAHHEPGGGGGFTPQSKPLPFYIPLFDRKGTPFVYLP